MELLEGVTHCDSTLERVLNCSNNMLENFEFLKSNKFKLVHTKIPSSENFS